MLNHRVAALALDRDELLSSGTFMFYLAILVQMPKLLLHYLHKYDSNFYILDFLYCNQLNSLGNL